MKFYILLYKNEKQIIKFNLLIIIYLALFQIIFFLRKELINMVANLVIIYAFITFTVLFMIICSRKNIKEVNEW